MGKWIEQYIRILKRDYPTKGSSIPFLRKRFSRETIRSKAKKLKIKVNKIWRRKHFKNTLDKYRVIKWADKEISILKREYPKIGIKVKRLLKKFTKAAIKQKANVLKIKRVGRNWTQMEIKKLKLSWQTKSKLDKLFPHRSLFAVYKKAQLLSLKRSRNKARRRK